MVRAAARYVRDPVKVEERATAPPVAVIVGQRAVLGGNKE